MKYFAYGSNMSLQRIRQRAPSAQVLGTYYLEKHALRFHKVGQDGSAKCDAYFTGDIGDVIYGLLFSIDRADKPVLDQAEGLGRGYDEKLVDVCSARDSAGDSAQGSVEQARLYYALLVDEALRPFTWYKEHVLIGAREAGLSKEYITEIENVEACSDPDPLRESSQLLIYRK